MAAGAVARCAEVLCSVPFALSVFAALRGFGRADTLCGQRNDGHLAWGGCIPYDNFFCNKLP